jgi:hypothetical protein
MRLQITIPEKDPRFDELRAVLEQAREQGRGNPASRMLLEWALMGFLFTHGRLGFAVPSSSNGVPAPLSGAASTGPGSASAPDTQSEAAPAAEHAPPLQEDDIDSVIEEAGWGFE